MRAAYEKNAGESREFPGTVGGGGGTAGPRLSPRAGLCLHPVARMRSVLSAQSLRILVFARREPRISEPMSLYRAGLKLALFLPLGVAMPPCGGEGFTDVSSVFTLPSRADATN